jgi:diguanylate cyclase (GGDEF)-like protein
VHQIASAAAVPLLTQRTVRAVLVLRTRRGDPVLTLEQVRLVEQLVNATAALMEREERRANDSRRQILASANDPLTGCANLDALDGRLREELERVRRYGSGLVFALLDIDALRELNHRLGEAAGDQFLAELGQLLQRELRTPDFIARYGSDDFALLMPATGVEGARRVIGRIAEALAHQVFSSFPSTERPRLAAGLVAFPHPAISGVEELLAMAERALAKGKTGGSGDRVGLAA